MNGIALGEHVEQAGDPLQAAGRLRRARQWCYAGVAVLACLPTLGGCYDAAAMLQTRRDEVDVLRLEEVDLGKFRITLPHLPGDTDGGVVDFHAFGQVARSHRQEVTDLLESRGPELRYRMLLSVRSMAREKLDEPKLESLRLLIADVINGSLEEKPVKSVGFFHFEFETH